MLGLFCRGKNRIRPIFNKIPKIYFGTLKPITLGDLQEGMKDATVRQWFKKVGDLVKEDEEIVEVATDKLVAPIPSVYNGKIAKIYFEVNQKCLLGKTLCDIELDDDNKAPASESKVNTQNIGESSSTSSKHHHKTGDPKILATPAVRFMLKQNQLKGEHVKGTGKQGRILKEDVLNHMSNLNSRGGQAEVHLSHKTAQSASQHSNHPPSHSTKSEQHQYLAADQPVTITGYKKGMTKTMTKSAEIPSFLYTDEFSVEKLIKTRSESNKVYPAVKMTYMPYIIKAVSLTLRQFPILNSITLDHKDSEGLITDYIIKKDHNISIAIDSPNGLVVPNIKAVQNKSVVAIQRELDELREKAKHLKLTSSDLTGGTFSISNVGNIGGKVLNPCILPPQVAIIAVSKMYDSVKLVHKEELSHYDNFLELKNNDRVGVAYQKVLNMCMSADHRVIDGATVARFSETLKTYIENPIKIWMDDS